MIEHFLNLSGEINKNPEDYPVMNINQEFNLCKITFKSICYNFEDFKEALDIFIKMFTVFNIKYNKNFGHILSYVKQYIYKMEDNYISVNVTKLLSNEF